MTCCCPYCDGNSISIKDVVRIGKIDPDEIGDRMIEVCRAVCKECGEVSYAYRFFRSSDSYDLVRRDQLEAKTGVRIRTGLSKPKRRWTS